MMTSLVTPSQLRTTSLDRSPADSVRVLRKVVWSCDWEEEEGGGGVGVVGFIESACGPVGEESDGVVCGHVPVDGKCF